MAESLFQKVVRSDSEETMETGAEINSVFSVSFELSEHCTESIEGTMRV